MIFISSCSSGLVNKNNRDPFTSSGFALIYNDDDFKNKIISRKLNNDLLEVGHYKIKRNSIVKITNPQNKKSLELKVTKNLKYPDFFKIVITENVLLMLDLDLILEVKQFFLAFLLYHLQKLKVYRDLNLLNLILAIDL